MNKYEEFLAHWIYNPLVNAFIKDAISQWTTTAGARAEALTHDERVALLTDCLQALEAGDLSTLPDEALAVGMRVQCHSKHSKERRLRHFLTRAEESALAHECGLRAVRKATEEVT